MSRLAVLLVLTSTASADVTLGKTKLDVFLTGDDTWLLAARANDLEVRIPLPALKGTMQGGDATLLRAGQATVKGIWKVTITKAEVGYLKSPGLCSGTVTATFGKDLEVRGTFTDAGCISYRPRP